MNEDEWYEGEEVYYEDDDYPEQDRDMMKKGLDLGHEFASVERLKYLAKTMKGTNFALAMRDSRGQVGLYVREHQPCQGGEMRKYFKSHGEDCEEARRNDNRPGDLHHPFPDGNPVGIAVHFQRQHSKEFLDIFLSPKTSPFRRGLPSDPSDIHIVFDENEYPGLIVTQTDFDPTVFVNLLQTINQSQVLHFQILKEANATPEEIILHFMLAGNSYFLPDGVGLAEVNQYYFPVKAGIKKILTGDCNNLSGRSFFDRGDYNRPDIQNLFKDEANGVNWHHEITSRAAKEIEKVYDAGSPYEYKYKLVVVPSVEEYLKTAREVIAIAMAEEPKIEEKAA